MAYDERISCQLRQVTMLLQILMSRITYSYVKDNLRRLMKNNNLRISEFNSCFLENEVLILIS
jgi:hypothetical protein